MADDIKKDEEVPSDKQEEIKEDEKPVENVEKAAAKEEVKVEEPKKEEVKAEEAVAEVKQKAAPSGKFKDLIKEIEGLTTLELAELVKELEERFGVSAAAPVATAGAPVVSGDAAEEAEEKSSFTLVLADSGAQKIAVIKALREINQELGLKEAKDLADGAPKEIKKDMSKADAEEAKKKLEAAGAKVELK